MKVFGHIDELKKYYFNCKNYEISLLSQIRRYS